MVRTKVRMITPTKGGVCVTTGFPCTVKPHGREKWQSCGELAKFIQKKVKLRFVSRNLKYGSCFHVVSSSSFPFKII